MYISDQGRGLGTVTNEEIDKVLKSKHVKDHVKRMVATVDFKNGELKHLDDESQTKPEVMKATDVIGVNKSEIEGKFRSGSLFKLAAAQIMSKVRTIAAILYPPFL